MLMDQTSKREQQASSRSPKLKRSVEEANFKRFKRVQSTLFSRLPSVMDGKPRKITTKFVENAFIELFETKGSLTRSLSERKYKPEERTSSD